MSMPPHANARSRHERWLNSSSPSRWHVHTHAQGLWARQGVPSPSEFHVHSIIVSKFVFLACIASIPLIDLS